MAKEVVFLQVSKWWPSSNIQTDKKRRTGWWWGAIILKKSPFVRGGWMVKPVPYPSEITTLEWNINYWKGFYTNKGETWLVDLGPRRLIFRLQKKWYGRVFFWSHPFSDDQVAWSSHNNDQKLLQQNEVKQIDPFSSSQAQLWRTFYRSMLRKEMIFFQSREWKTESSIRGLSTKVNELNLTWVYDNTQSIKNFHMIVSLEIRMALASYIMLTSIFWPKVG